MFDRFRKNKEELNSMLQIRCCRTFLTYAK